MAQGARVKASYSQRVKEFDIWRIENDKTMEGLAREIGFSYQRLSILMRRSETVTPQMHERLSRVIPERLLPPPVPKTRSKPSQIQHATAS